MLREMDAPGFYAAFPSTSPGEVTPRVRILVFHIFRKISVEIQSEKKTILEFLVAALQLYTYGNLGDIPTCSLTNFTSPE